MPIILTLMLVVLAAPWGALGTKYGIDFDDEGYRVAFDHDETSRVVEARMTCDVPYPYYYSYHVTLNVDGGDGWEGCSRYYYVTNDGVKLLQQAREELKKNCDLTLPEGAFTDMYFFDEFMIINLDDVTNIVVNRV
ncbi:hypothetical protein FOZ60_008922 [Perkinsus olseni]|uniref:Uncharacterized protein n=2 Tax=Perkinsus olseni TaxID=32597 RepID=A0A7J6NIF4_PEROL|nr:hypothetical protein FOZ60_008922 [Perkinsus olseni]